MIIFGTVLAICCLGAAKATPSHWASLPISSSGSSASGPLEGTPDLETYGKISFPNSDILDLGEYSQGQLPADEIKITKESKISYPQPYPIKVPVPQPYPVHIEKPVPVHDTQIVKVPVPYPQVIEKRVPYPIEVPKPYPVPVQSHDQGNQLGGGGLEHSLSFSDGGGLGGGGGGSYGGHALEGNGYGVQEQHDLPSDEGWQSGIGGGPNPYEAKTLEEGYGAPLGGENSGWQPIGGGELEGQYH